MTFLKPLTNYFIMCFAILFSMVLFAQESVTDSIYLIQPTGPNKVGTMVYEWVDLTRNQKISNNDTDKRIIIAQIWYPAVIDSTSKRAYYNSLSKDYRNVISNSYLRPKFNQNIENSNVILISPGRGTERYLYTSLSEELASHGYVVVSIDMPEIGYTIYSDGLIIKPSINYKPPRGMMAGPYEKVDAFFEIPTKIGFQDLMFVMDKLSELNNTDPNNRFKGNFNLKEIGIFGHSLGGRIAGKFASEVKAVKGYISMEGIPPREVRYEGLLNIPVAMLCSSGTWPYAKENYFSLINNRNSPVYMIELSGFGHNSVTDNPFIFPKSFNYKIDPIEGLNITRKIVLSYFNDFLRRTDSFQDELKNIKEIIISIHK